MRPKKRLGQHWLRDEAALDEITSAASLTDNDVVLEVGPGLGNLTRKLQAAAGRVVAVEIDEALAANLTAADNLEIVNQDILKFDLTQLPPDYKLVANIPYYLTSNLIRVLSESPNSPSLMVLLVQKEVARRLAAGPGQMSLLSVSAQLRYQPELGPVVQAELFEPPPKVDSQVIILRRRPAPLLQITDERLFYRVAKAGFAGRRKKLRSSLAAGLGLSKPQSDELLKKAGIDGGLRAQNLSLDDWHKLYIAMLQSKYYE